MVTVNTNEIARFSALASQWWDANGPMRPLHKLNPARLTYIEQQLRGHFGDKKPTVLDLGCGAGLVAENLAARGFDVTGVDASTDLIAAAKAHAAEKNIYVTYQQGSAESLVEKKKKFDAVLALEIIEHVENAPEFVQLCSRLLKPDGLIIFSTLNRNAKSMVLGIVAAEYILRWLPTGTHDWKKFIKPSELANMCETCGLQVKNICGLTYQPLSDHFSLNERDVSMNYFLTAKI